MGEALSPVGAGLRTTVNPIKLAARGIARARRILLRELSGVPSRLPESLSAHVQFDVQTCCGFCCLETWTPVLHISTCLEGQNVRLV